MNSPERTTFIYDYTKQSLSSVNRSIDVVTDKLTKVLAFSGLLLKFAVDIENRTDLPIFGLKLIIISILMASVGFCAAGLWPKKGSESNLKPSYFVRMAETVDTATREQFQEAAVKAWLQAIPEQAQFRDSRIAYLNLAIGSSVTAGLLFGLNGIISSIS